MGKVAVTIHFYHERMKVLAIQTLRGPASEYLTHLLRQQPQITWDAMLQTLVSCFSDTLDMQLAMQRLKRTKQNSNQTVQNFAEGIIDLAEEACNTTNLTDHLIQIQLNYIFLDGLQEDSIACRIIRVKPQTLDGTLQIAITE